MKRELEQVEAPGTSLPSVGEDGKYPFPIGDGGTFIDIALRAQQESSWLIRESTALCFAAGLIKADDAEQFAAEFVNIISDSWLQNLLNVVSTSPPKKIRIEMPGLPHVCSTLYALFLRWPFPPCDGLRIGPRSWACSSPHQCCVGHLQRQVSGVARVYPWQKLFPMRRAWL